MNVRDAKLLSSFGELKFLLLTEEEPPDAEEFEYRNEGDIWLAEKDGWVAFFRDSGSGGSSRSITTDDGEERSFGGVGASRCSIVNKECEELGPCVTVKYTTDEDEFERGNGFSAHITLDAAREVADRLGVKMEREVDDRGEVRWAPKRVREKE